MSYSGVLALKRITIRYCQHGGSSRGVREFLASKEKKQFEEENPHCEVVVFKQNGKHPLLLGEYISPQRPSLPPAQPATPPPKVPYGSPTYRGATPAERQPQLKFKQTLERSNNTLCIKNQSVQDIYEKLLYLRNKRGGKNRNWHENNRHKTRNPSIQGVWHPEQWSYLYERVKETQPTLAQE
uniref:Large ribosomal subunit protein mL43 n=1 Tax=Arcella intermedia TaxID=1963864 RepID=A0A6B2LLD5_9EUKA|eukprot:TRINITY_DN2480_c0_g1_i1.p1 TRINITY_DN2480_c0_g1~~TRINITY_DN2480_c0_g1_i1.p1  ORF type:complete len:183 (-),score=41.46 TRINITY_DN2480_c0_g1_i1:48-596(-)